ncbi:hypothetical protein BLNAU_5852 [Blattamonas nauphoetae]|uniref:Uncharacterized protein n=1 Tax=Blattamonas nauphoetae TaxID=2049346 RepID=A0ABQ9Y6G9_9EUKA|nr:hypothetical protein BLNAU_5852 [Blattamonas nauphoetae]
MSNSLRIENRLEIKLKESLNITAYFDQSQKRTVKCDFVNTPLFCSDSQSMRPTQKSATIRTDFHAHFVAQPSRLLQPSCSEMNSDVSVSCSGLSIDDASFVLGSGRLLSIPKTPTDQPHICRLLQQARGI